MRLKFKIISFVSVIALTAALFSGCAGASGSKSGSALQNAAGTDGLKVIFIDVGQGDSALLELDGETALIDGGESEYAEKVEQTLGDEGITEITYLIATHPHSDHIGSLAKIVKDYGIDNIYMPEAETNTKTFENLLDAIDAKGLSVTSPAPGDKLPFGGADGVFLGPVKDYDNLNDDSIVLRLVYGKTSFLFAGDIETRAEKDICGLGYELKSDVLKVPHHGSDTSGLKDFLSAVSPGYAVISVGADNIYGHPNAKIVEAYVKTGAVVLQTSICGDITFYSDGKTVNYATGK